MRPFSVKTEQGRFVNISNEESLNFNLVKNDILVTRYNGSLELVGVAAMVRNDNFIQFTYSDKLIRIRANAIAEAAFLEICINSPDSRAVIKNNAKTTSGQTGISGKDLRALCLQLPPLSEQHEIVRRVEALFSLADRLEGRYTAAAATFQRLTPALLAKAFRGELVEQDPNDESASVLLARIRAEREAKGAAKKSGGRGRKPAAPRAKIQAEAPAEVGTEPRRRGRPPRARTDGANIPEASSFEEAVRQLEAQKLARAAQASGEREPVGSVQGGLFGEE